MLSVSKRDVKQSFFIFYLYICDFAQSHLDFLFPFKRTFTYFQCSRKLPTLYRTFGQTEYESLSDRQNFCLTKKQSARFWKNHQGRRGCVFVGGGGGGGGGGL